MAATEVKDAQGAHDAEDADWDKQGIEGADAEEATPPMQIPIPGTLDTISLNAGGPKPTSSEVRLNGASLPLEGQYVNDELVTLLVEVRISDVQFPIQRDKYGNATKCTRRHIAKPVSVRKFGE